MTFFVDIYTVPTVEYVLLERVQRCIYTCASLIFDNEAVF